MQSHTSILIIGASGGIAQALINHVLANSSDNVVAVSRAGSLPNIDNSRVLQLQCDYSEYQVEQICQQLSQQSHVFSQVYVCNGLLHTPNFMPEKKLTDINEAQLQQYFQANVITPMLWLAQLEQLNLVKQAQICVFSARVGSIGDNRLGGWYGYRGSKSALNMMVKCAAIELKRKHKQWQFVLFHPGTTDTQLSKPFQANVKPDKLFTAEFVAAQLSQIMLDTRADSDITRPVYYLDWQGNDIDW